MNEVIYTDLQTQQSWTRAQTEIQNIYPHNQNGYQNQGRYPNSFPLSNQLYAFPENDGNLSLKSVNSNMCCDQVFYNQLKPKHNSNVSGVQSNFEEEDTEVWASAKLLKNTMPHGALSEENGNGHSPHISRTDLNHFSATKYPDESENTCERFRIIRRSVRMADTTVNDVYDSQSNLLSIDLRIIGGALEEILSYPWSPIELKEGRRTLRIERFQKGCMLQAFFLIIQRPTSLMPQGTRNQNNYLEVSCIRFDHRNGDAKNYFITSAEVIDIVEFLIGNKTLSSILKWKERGRIRSNLAPLWFKNWSNLGPMHLRFENQIRRYNSRNPHTMLKYMIIAVGEFGVCFMEGFPVLLCVYTNRT